jgi:L-asparaginase
MEKTIIISTGGTFNKIYNKFTGNLDIDKSNSSINSIQKEWLSSYKFIDIINKDSLDFTTQDREELLKTIKELNYKKIVIIHGTDTIDITAKFLDSAKLDKTIVLTGAMVPYSINPIEATANLAFAIGYSNLAKNGIYIAINGVAQHYSKVIKNRQIGKFELI